MKCRIVINAEFEKDKPHSQVFIKEKEFESEKEIKSYCESVMNKLLEVYESNIFMWASVDIETIKYDTEKEINK